LIAVKTLVERQGLFGLSNSNLLFKTWKA